MLPKTFFTFLVLINLCCMVGQPLNPDIINLNGYWKVDHLRYDNTIISRTQLEIIHKNQSIWFLEGVDTISFGILNKDTIQCRELYGLDIGEIYIITNDYLRSAVPSLEISNGLVFRRRIK